MQFRFHKATASAKEGMRLSGGTSLCKYHPGGSPAAGAGPAPPTARVILCPFPSPLPLPEEAAEGRGVAAVSRGRQRTSQRWSTKGNQLFLSNAVCAEPGCGSIRSLSGLKASLGFIACSHSLFTGGKKRKQNLQQHSHNLMDPRKCYGSQNVFFSPTPFENDHFGQDCLRCFWLTSGRFYKLGSEV